MPDTFTYPYGIGRFSPRGHSLNIGDLSDGVNTGALTKENFVDDFEITSGMIMREQNVFSRADNTLDTTTFYGEAFGVSQSEGRAFDRGGDPTFNENIKADSPNVWTGVAGAGVRWYQPYNASLGVLQWSFFASYNKWIIDDHSSNRNEVPAVNVSSKTAQVSTIAILDTPYGSHFIDASRRNYSHNCAYPAGKKAAFGVFKPSKTHKRIVQQEAHSAQYVDQHFVFDFNSVYPSGLSTVYKGWYELRILAYMEQPTHFFKTHRNVHLRFGNHFRKHSVIMNDKLSIGIRNARVVTFL